MESSPNISNWLVEGLSGESQGDGMRSRLAESVRGPMKKMPHRGRVAVWPSPSVPCGLWLWGLRRRSCTPFQALVMVKSIHRTGRFPRLHTTRGTASTFSPKSKSRLARLGVISNTVKDTRLSIRLQAALTPLFAVSRGSVCISRSNSTAVCRQGC